MLRNLISSLFFVFVFCGVSFGATICVDIPDVQVPYVQNIANKEGALSVQIYLQRIVTAAVDSWQKQQDEEKLVVMKGMFQSLSLPTRADVELMLLQAKLREDAATLSTGGVTP